MGKMIIKVVDYLGNFKVYYGVINISITKQGYKIENCNGELINRECTKFETVFDIMDMEDFDCIITER